MQDRKCNELCALLEKNNKPQNGVIIHSDLLSYYLQKNYPGLYLVSSTTKVLTNFSDFLQEIDREEFRYVVLDFRLNKKFDQLNQMNTQQKEKVEFLCNECCWFGCRDRKRCYEAVSRKNLGESGEEHYCVAPDAEDGYLFSKAMANPGFIGTDAIKISICPWDFPSSRSRGGDLAVR